LLTLGAWLLLAPAVPAADPVFEKDVRPLLARYCVRCHGAARPKGGLSLASIPADPAKARALWDKVADNLRSGEMPPAGAKRPTAVEMETWTRWLGGVLKADCNGPQDPGRVTLRRLNRAEYNNTIRDLLGVDFQPARDFPADDVGYGFDNIGDVLSLPPLLMEKYLAAAEKVVDEAMKSPALRRRLAPRGRRGNAPQGLRQFASRAYRRPATDDEVKRLERLVRLAREQGDDATVGMKLALQAMLVSPHFLFRVEREPAGKDGRISPWELATRLSYFLWSSMPDEELFRLAREDKLRQPGVLLGQVTRMLKDPKAQALADNFASQWLNTRGLASFNPDPKRFPDYNPALRQAMLRETGLFFMHVVREDRSVLDFLDSDYTFANGRLARHYGLAGVTGEGFRKVSLAGTPRGGVLTQASVLAVTSNPTRTSPVKRGKWILDNILGTPPPPPPPDVDELKEADALKGTLRQQMEQHRKNPTCASCHQRMDPLGFGFENFDAVGRWRDRENKHAIDASGVLPDGSTFKGPAELRKVLLKKKDLFVRCLSEKLFTYALGRGTTAADRCFLDRIAANAAKADYRFVGLVNEIIRSDPFQKRARGTRK
jgi:cytochrome c553